MNDDWERLLDAMVGLGSDLSLQGVLERITAAAASLVDAQYAALGVLSSGAGPRLRTFVTYGLDDAQIAAIGDRPEGHGILGLIIDRPEPLRIEEIAAHTESVGFPPGHPPMRSFLGVPIRVREKVFGNLYLTEKSGGAFTADDERVVTALATAAGVAIEHAELYEESDRRQAWLTLTAEVGLPTSEEQFLRHLPGLLAHAVEVAGGDHGWVHLGREPEDLALAASLHEQDPPAAVLDAVIRSCHSRTPTLVEGAGFTPGGTAVVVPVLGPQGPEGTLAIACFEESDDRLNRLDPELPLRYAEQLALSLHLARAREDQARLTLLEDRDRIGRDLHDVVIQRLFAVGLSLQALSGALDGVARVRVDAAVDELDATIREIRRSIFDLGNDETAADIQTEVTRMVERAAATLKFRPALRFEGPVRALVDREVAPDLLAVLSEALSNAAKHAEATSVTVVLAASDHLTLTVTDNGRGMPEGVRESGLSNMRQRAERLGGRLEIRTGPPMGTTIEWTVPTAR